MRLDVSQKSTDKLLFYNVLYCFSYTRVPVSYLKVFRDHYGSRIAEQTP